MVADYASPVGGPRLRRRALGNLAPLAFPSTRGDRPGGDYSRPGLAEVSSDHEEKYPVGRAHPHASSRAVGRPGGCGLPEYSRRFAPRVSSLRRQDPDCLSRCRIRAVRKHGRFGFFGGVRNKPSLFPFRRNPGTAQKPGKVGLGVCPCSGRNTGQSADGYRGRPGLGWAAIAAFVQGQRLEQ